MLEQQYAASTSEDDDGVADTIVHGKRYGKSSPQRFNDEGTVDAAPNNAHQDGNSSDDGHGDAGDALFQDSGGAPAANESAGQTAASTADSRVTGVFSPLPTAGTTTATPPPRGHSSDHDSSDGDKASAGAATDAGGTADDAQEMTRSDNLLEDTESEISVDVARSTRQGPAQGA